MFSIKATENLSFCFFLCFCFVETEIGLHHDIQLDETVQVAILLYRDRVSFHQISCDREDPLYIRIFEFLI